LQYEQSLEKYLGSKQFKDWIPKKDEQGNQVWFNMKTLQE